MTSTADISLIRRAFRRKAKSCHPDLFQQAPDAERKRQQKNFIRLSQAYETLADPERRRVFDRQLGKTGTKLQQPHDQKNQTSSSSSSSRSSFNGKRNFSTSSQNTSSTETEDTLEDILRDAGEILEDFGLSLKDPLEKFVEWAQEIFQEAVEAFDDEDEVNSGKNNSKTKTHSKSQVQTNTLDDVEAELERFKNKRAQNSSKSKLATQINIKDSEIEQELRSIKKKYKL